MSKVKIQGHASGTGVLTVTAPNTSTDRTITLPDGTGTLLTTDGDGSSLTGTADATKLPLAGGTMTGVLTVNSGGNLGFQANGTVYTQIWQTLQSPNDLTLKTTADKYISFQPNSVEKLRITSDGRGLSQFTAKGWINMKGTGTISIRDSHNVSSIQDGGTGDYDIFWDVDLANVNYCPVTANAAENHWGEAIHINSLAVSSLSILNSNESGTYYDSSRLYVAIFGD